MSVIAPDKVWWPRAKAMPTRWSVAAGPFDQAPRGWVLHVVQGDGSPWRTFDSSVYPNRKFSHIWVAKNGDVEQYAPLDHKSWAQQDGNATFWSAETEGMPEQGLTVAQIHSLAEFHNWVGTVDRIANVPADSGVACHYIGGASWGGHTCPDPKPGVGPRSRQRDLIISTAVALRGQPKGAPDMQQLTDDEIRRIAQECAMECMHQVWGALFKETVNGQDVPVTAGTRLARAAAPVPSADQIAAAVRAILPPAVTAGATLDPHAVAVAVVDEMQRRLQS